MYRIIPLRILRRTAGVKFDEMVPSDIPVIHGIDRVIHGPNSISPGPVEDITPPVKRPWYMHPGQDDNLMVLQGTRYVDIYDPKNQASFIITPDKVFKNDKLYYDGPAMVGALPTKNKIEKPHPHRVWLFYVLAPRRGGEREGRRSDLCRK